MRLLVLGGTAFLGRTLAGDALARGHDVTCLARGESGAPPDGVRWVRADRDVDDGLAEVAAEQWDAVVDVSRQPGQVRRAARDLAGVTPYLLLVSTGNVYADHATPGASESTALLAPLDGDVMPDMSLYDQAKVACEAAVQEAFGGRSLIARAGLIGGPGDWSGRTGWWPWRMAHPTGTRVLAPDALDEAAQVLDVRDLAAWLVTCAERQTTGVMNACGETTSLGGVLEVSREVTGFDGEVALAAPEWLVAQRISPWMGPRSLPLWIGDPDWAGFSARSSALAREHGLVTRPLAATLRDTLAYEEARPASEPRQCGLSDADEADLLRLLAERVG